ncbi:MAG: DNA-protecting protein DprA [Bacteroidetes bacterium]|nr:DNA-protecting protein DprA [Bacteroidota bacterium]
MPAPFNIQQLLHLASIPGMSNSKLKNLIDYFGSPEQVLAASPLQLIKVEGIKKELASAVAHAETNKTFIEDQLKRINRIEGKILTIWDSEYPPLLKEVFDAPVLLFLRGTITLNDQYAMAIVGTRRPSAYGISVAENFSKELSGMGITIISGLARGIDTHAHHGALKGEGRTIAVLGGAVDKIYPKENERLAEKICSNGAVISEMFMGAKAELWSFPKRNRIISGMSLGTIIIESDEDGGAMITARTTIDQNRELFCVPGNITEHKSNGTNKLIKLGQAKLVQTVDDILVELEAKLKPILKTKKQEPAPQLSVFEQKIFDCLSYDPIHIDVLSEKSELSSADTLVNLLSLEFKGMVRQMAGKMFVKM